MIDLKTTPQPLYQGTAKLGQKELIRRWFKGLSEAPQAGRKVVWTFVTSLTAELFRSFGIVDFVFPEIQALQVAAKGQAPKFLAIAEEDLGYSVDLCGYLKIDVGLMNEGLEHPSGKIPPPDLIVAPTHCMTYVKWAEIWKERYGVPLMLLDIPVRVTDEEHYWGSEMFQNDRQYLLRQLWDLVEVLEKLTGNKLDLDLLAEYERQWNSVCEFWPQIADYNHRQPAVYDAFRDGLYYMGALQATRGCDGALDYFRAVKKELEERVDLGLYPNPNEQLRLGIHFAPPWSSLKPFFSIFEKWNVSFAYGTYMNMVGLYRHDYSRPLETIAEYLVYANHPEALTKIVNWKKLLSRGAREYHLDGIVLQGLKSCRMISTPLLDYKEALQQEGLPTLLLEADVVDPRYFSAAQLKNRADAFCEMLLHKKTLLRADTRSLTPLNQTE